MIRPREERGILSRLPDDEAYWEALTDRIVLDAAGRLDGYRQNGRRWWHGISRASTPLTFAAAASVVIALLWLPEVDGEGVPDAPAAAVFGLTPTGPLADRLVGSPTAPTVASLMITSTPELSR